MGVREQVMGNLLRGQFEVVAGQAGEQPRVLRAVLGRLWDADERVRSGAALTLGVLAARQPAKAVELVRRFLWALNDESGTNGAAVVPALLAMAKRAPAVVGPYAGALVAHLDDEGLREELVEVLAALYLAEPRWTEPYAADLARWGVYLGDKPPLGEKEGRQ